MEIRQCYLDRHPCYQAGKKIQMKGLMLHSVGCSQPSAQNFVTQWNRKEAKRACVHGFIDGNTGEIFQTLPWDYRAWHCGGEGNNTHIGIEMCEPSCIHYTGGSTFTCLKIEEAKEVVNRTYNAAIELFAYLCEKYQLDPLQDGVIISHKEGHDRGIASGHGDPEHLWRQLNTDYNMDGFRKDVNNAMNNGILNRELNDEDVKREAVQSPVVQITNSDVTQEGDHVKVRGDAVYYNGKEMPDWVKADTWVVKSINKDRAVIDRNVSGSRAICSPIDIKYLIKQEAEGNRDQNPSGNKLSDNGFKSISSIGIELITKYEGCHLEAYKCPAAVWTIGYGHTAGVQPGQKITQQQAKDMLMKDVVKYADYVISYVGKGIITFSLTQNKFDALVSFAYNCGPENLKKLVNGRSAIEVANKMSAYNKGGGKELEGLTRRRNEERELFLRS